MARYSLARGLAPCCCGLLIGRNAYMRTCWCVRARACSHTHAKHACVQDCAFPLLRGINATDNLEQGFADVKCDSYRGSTP